MAAPEVVKKELILEAAERILEREGYKAVKAKRIADMLGCSTQPIYMKFGMGTNDGGILAALRQKALERCRKYAEEWQVLHPEDNFYQAYCIAALRLARHRGYMFQLLCLYNGGVKNKKVLADLTSEEMKEIVRQSYGYEGNTAMDFHTQMTMYVCGLGAMIASGFAEVSEEETERLVKEQLSALKNYFDRN